MKLNEFTKIEEAPLFGYLGQAAQKKAAGTGMSSTENQMAMDMFIDDFVDDAYGAIKSGVESGVISADANLPMGDEAKAKEENPQEKPEQQQQNQTQQQQQTKSTVPQGGGKVPGQLSQTPNAIRKRQQRAAGQTPGKNVGLGDVVNQLNPQKAKSTGGTITQTPRGYVHSANQKPAATQGNPKFLSKNKQQASKQPAMAKESKYNKLNNILESVIKLNEKGPTPAFAAPATKIKGGFGTGPYNKPYTPLKLPQQSGQPAPAPAPAPAPTAPAPAPAPAPTAPAPAPTAPAPAPTAPAPAPTAPAPAPAPAPTAPAPAPAPGGTQTGNTGQTTTQGGMGIAQYLKTKWFPFYMGDKADPSTQPILDKHFSSIQTSYPTDGGRQALGMLAKAAYSMAKANIRAGNPPPGAKDIAGQLKGQGTAQTTDINQLATAIKNLKNTDKNAYSKLLKLL